MALFRHRTAANPPVVLYVEDHDVNVALMKAVFEHLRPTRLMVAVDGASALRLATEQRPDLMLLDIGLPDCRGDDLLRALRRLPGCAEVPAIAVTADTSFDAAGTTFGEVWRKPLDVPGTLQRLHRLLEGGADGDTGEAGADTSLATSVVRGWPPAMQRQRLAWPSP